LILTFEQIIDKIEKRDYSPVYFLHGEEAFFIDTIVDKIQKSVLTDQEREFNQMVFYGKDAIPQNIVGSARQYPMMAEKRVVILKEAQQMKNLTELGAYIAKPVPSTILVIAHKDKKLDMRSAFAKTVKANALVFESKKLYENQVSSWIMQYSKSIGLNLTNGASGMMTVLLGTDLSKIENELHKLKIAVDTTKPIDVDEVKNNIGLSREYNVFELNNALGKKDITKVFRIIDIFSTNPTQYPLTYVVLTLYAYFSKVLITAENMRMSDVDLVKILKINRFFLKDYKQAARNYSRMKLIDIIHTLKEYDLKSKGIGVRSVSQISLIKEMVLKII